MLALEMIVDDVMTFIDSINSRRLPLSSNLPFSMVILCYETKNKSQQEGTDG